MRSFDSPELQLEGTGERYLPGTMAGVIELEHLHRYAIARELAFGKGVLDIGCGEGYGSDLLASVAKRVTAIDISVAAVAYASAKYRRRNLKFVCASAADIPLPDASIDLVASFETIEHHDEHRQMLAEIRRVLRPDGVLIISSPDRHEYSDVPGYINPFHVRELYLNEFEGLLKAEFSYVKILGQRVSYGSFVGPLDGTSTPLTTFTHVDSAIRRDNGILRPVYFIALASNAALAEGPSGLYDGSSQLDRQLAKSDPALSRLFPHLFRLLDERQSEIRRLAAQAGTRDAEIARLVEQVAARDADNARFAMEVAARNVEVARLGEQVAAREADAAHLVEVVAARTAEVAHLIEEVTAGKREADRLTVELAAREAEVSRLGKDVAERDVDGARLVEEVAARSAELARLAGHVAAERAEIDRLVAELAARDAEAARLSKELAARDADGARLFEEVAVRDAELAHLVQEVAAGSAEVDRLIAEVIARDSEVAFLSKAVAARDADGARLFEEVTSRNAEVARLIEERAAARAEADHLIAEVAAKDSDVARLVGEVAARGATLTRVQAEAARGVADVAHLRAETGRLRGERDDLCATVEAMRLSKSWQLTAPLRFVKTTASNLRPLRRLRMGVSIFAHGIYRAVPLSVEGKVRLKGLLFSWFPCLFKHTLAYRSWTVFRAAQEPDADQNTVASTERPPHADTRDHERLEASAVSELVGERRGEYVPFSEDPPAGGCVRTVAFYLPQYHPIPENDRWWERGFTEWHNVMRGKPQFVGHYQPHLPGELGFYDLRVPAVQERQVELAKAYGIGAYCFYFYWFDGKTLLEMPLRQYLDRPELDLPFCICWANENWTRRWDGLESDVLIAQRHSPEDDLAFIAHVSEYLRDPRYLRINGRPLLVVYRPSLLPAAGETSARWRSFCRSEGIGEIFLAYTQSFENVDPATYCFDAAIEFPPNNSAPPRITDTVLPINPDYRGTLYDWRVFIDRSRAFAAPAYKLFRCVCPSWDNDARRPGRGVTFLYSSPDGYQEWLFNAALETAQRLPQHEERLVFINAWNEWAEGTHLEPDQRYGYAYLEATRSALKLSALALAGPPAKRRS